MCNIIGIYNTCAATDVSALRNKCITLTKNEIKNNSITEILASLTT